jgi:hypothetical protein
MKKLTHSLMNRATRILMRSNLAWEVACKLPNRNYFLQHRSSVVKKSVRKKCAAYLQPLRVLDGPFAGTQYAEAASVGSSLWPKLLGTYESELRDCIATACKRGYRKIIDVGFAEGFYLIGLGKQFEASELIGFDIEPEAERLCRANAEANGIGLDRLRLYGAFDAQKFEQCMDAESLVVVDCEGFENEVISALSPQGLGAADWLIETHDHLISGTTERLASTLAKTHSLQIIHTDPDLESKKKLLPEPIRNVCDKYEQEALVTEGRLAEQSWIFATRKVA